MVSSDRKGSERQDPVWDREEGMVRNIPTTSYEAIGKRARDVKDAGFVPMRILVFTVCEIARDRHRPRETKVGGPVGLGPTYIFARFMATYLHTFSKHRVP